MALHTLYRGENIIVSRTLTLADGVTPLNVASLVTPGTQAQLIQRASIKATAALGFDPVLHVGAAANVLEYEISSTVSVLLRAGDVCSIRWTFKLVDAQFLAGGHFIDVTEEEVFLVK